MHLKVLSQEQLSLPKKNLIMLIRIRLSLSRDLVRLKPSSSRMGRPLQYEWTNIWIITHISNTVMNQIQNGSSCLSILSSLLSTNQQVNAQDLRSWKANHPQMHPKAFVLKCWPVHHTCIEPMDFDWRVIDSNPLTTYQDQLKNLSSYLRTLTFLVLHGTSLVNETTNHPRA